MPEQKGGVLAWLVGRRTAVTWLSIWFSINVGVTLLSKYLYRSVGFQFPVLLTFVHMVCSGVGASVQRRRHLANVSGIASSPTALRSAVSQVSRNTLLRVLAFSCLFCANIVVGNVSLRHVSVSLVQVVRSTIPGLTMLLSLALLPAARFDTATFLTVVPVVSGVALASYGELEFHLFGFLMTLLVCVLSSLKTVVSKLFLTGPHRVEPMLLLNLMAPSAAVQLAVLAWVSGEVDRLRDDWLPLHSSASERLACLLLLLLSGSMAFGLNIASFQFNRHTSPLTVTIAGNVKHAVTIALSVLLFEQGVSLAKLVGTLITLAGAACYSHLDYRSRYCV